MEKNTANRRKIFYVPGIISATILPVVFYFLAQEPLQKLPVTAIKVYWFDSTWWKGRILNYSKFYGGFLPERNYLNLVLKGNDQDDAATLEFAQIRIKEIIQASDTLNGLHFVFKDGSHYGTFVQLLDRLRMENARFYVPTGSHLWFYHWPPEPTSFDSIVNTCGYIQNKPEISWWAKTKEKVEHVWSSSWQLIVSFSGFTFLILLLRQKRKTI